MKELFLIKDTLPNKISYYHLLLLLASLPFNMFYSHVILISLAIHTIIQFNKQTVKVVFNWRIFLLQTVFIITIISTIYTVNPPGAFNEWGKQIAILILPVVFCFNGLDVKKYRNQLLLGFSVVCAITVVYLYYNAFHIIRYYHLPLSTVFSGAFTNHNFSEPIDMHATFLSMQLIIALIYMIQLSLKTHPLSAKIFYLICAITLMAGLFQLCSKSALFCVFVIVNLVVPLFLFQGKKRWGFMFITMSLSIVAVACMFSVKTFRDRYVSALQLDFSKPTAGEFSDPRLARWSAGSELIVKKPLLGYGAGSEIGLLHEVFFTKKYYDSFLRGLNVHSQYLSFLIKSGIVGLLVYLTTLILGFRESIKKKDILFFTFMLIIAVVSFSENLFDVDKGIFFYALFFSFFVFSENGINPSLSKSAT